MPGRSDPLRIAMHVVPYVAFFFLSTVLSGWLFLGVGGYLVGITCSLLFSAIAANWLALRIFEHRRLGDAGLWWNRAAADNLALGLAGGIGSACLVLGPPLVLGAAHLAPVPNQPATMGTFLLVTALLAAGAAGEELFF